MLEWRGTVIAVVTIFGNRFEGFLRKVEHGCIFIEVKDKGTFCCAIESIAVAAKVSQVSLAKEVKIQ